eukprot:1425618-Prymnesium_polylepis.1
MAGDVCAGLDVWGFVWLWVCALVPTSWNLACSQRALPPAPLIPHPPHQMYYEACRWATEYRTRTSYTVISTNNKGKSEA